MDSQHIKFRDPIELDPEETEFCVIIGKEIYGGCQQEICDGMDNCPYFTDTGE